MSPKAPARLLSRAQYEFGGLQGDAQSTLRDGTTLASESTVEIPLPDNDGDAIRTVHNVVHFRSDQLAKALDVAELLAIAVVSDKYALHNAVGPSASLWVGNSYGRCKTPEDFADLLLAGIKMHLDRTITELGRSLVRECTWRIVSPPEEESWAYHRIFVQLETKRLETQSKLQDARETELHRSLSLLGTSTSCKAGEPQIMKLMKALMGRKLWPFRVIKEASLFTVFWRILDLRLVEPDRDHISGCQTYQCKSIERRSWQTVLSSLTATTKVLMDDLDKLTYSSESDEDGLPRGFA